MKAFKGFTADLRSVMGDGKKETCCFVPGETKKVERSKTANSGFHCCENPFECLCYYQMNGKNRFFIVEAAVQETLNDETMIIERIVKQWLHDVPDSFKRCVDTIYEPAYDIEDLKDVVAPAGTNVIITRLAGLGKYMMTCQIDNNIDIVNMRTSEREKRTWPDMYQCIKSICKKISDSETYEDIWMRIYSESYPVPQNVESGDNSEDNSEEKPTQKPEHKRKTSKVTVTKKKPAVEKTHIEEKDNIVAPAQPVQHELPHQHNDTENESRNIEPYIEMMNDIYNKCVAMLRINDTDKADNFMQLLHDEFNKLKNAIKGGKENDISV